jgi:hypothetical protein
MIEATCMRISIPATAICVGLVAAGAKDEELDEIVKQMEALPDEMSPTGYTELMKFYRAAVQTYRRSKIRSLVVDA